MVERKDVGKRINLFRDHLHMTQEAFAVQLGMEEKRGRSTVNNWEQGKIQVKSDDLTHIGVTFGVSVDYLLGLSETMYIDEDMKVAHKVTGLSEKALNTFRTFRVLKDSPVAPLVPGFYDELNRILESLAKLKKICEYMAKATEIRNMLKDESPEGKQLKEEWENGISDQVHELANEYKGLALEPEEAIRFYERAAIDVFGEIVRNRAKEG